MWLTTLTALAATLIAARPGPIPAGVSIAEARSPTPGQGHGHGHKDSWGCNKPEYRPQITIRASANDTDDVSDAFLSALHTANNGGTVVLKEGETYVIGKKLLLTFLNDIHVQLDGEILFTDDIAYWQANNFYYDFQKSITFWVWGGQDIRIYGTGTLNGNGQAWYNGFAGSEILDPDNTYYRPILFLTDNATRVDISGITFLNSPCWNNFLVRTNDISFDRVRIEAVSNNASALPKNTDGWDTYNVDGISVTNSEVNIGDDCFSPKPNTSNIFVQNLWCNGTHGVSMGSIGQYPGVLDYIRDAYVENVTMLNAQNGARLKSWAGEDVGYGYIRNITFKDFYVENVDWPIVLDACYFNIEAAECAAFPSRVNISDILFQNFTGMSSGAEGPDIARLVCSSAAVCENIRLVDIDITSPETAPADGVVLCDGISGGVGVPCVSANATEAR
ncbi:hypothetical protein LTR53_011998 [Teratosphaeriaceae sp. CCFEE 6253]|nr:hypothetical protein LTR53_011998 [Teratosphaeriaceae sp. CCFEE 6253]